MRPDDKEFDYLRRLSPEFYRGQSYVHWSMTMDNRKTGWLIPIFYYKFREILTHPMFRYGLCCPIYCCMPDHLHLLWWEFSMGAISEMRPSSFERNSIPSWTSWARGCKSRGTITSFAKKNGNGRLSKPSSTTSPAIRNARD